MDMSLFIDLPFGDENALRDFIMRNSLAHKEVAVKFFAQGKSVPAYPIDNIDDLQDWLSSHNLIHQKELENLGSTQDYHLDQTDWNDEGQFREWLFMHALLHQSVNQALGITA